MKLTHKKTGKTYELIKRKVKKGFHIALFNFKTENFKQFLFIGNKKELLESLDKNFKIMEGR